MRLGVAAGADAITFGGLTGLGDLIVTCTSLHSRNARAGKLIGEGIEPAEAVRQVGTVEGYWCCHTAYELAKKLGVDYAWLAWIPYAQYYTLGKVVEKCDERRGSKQYPWGKIVLVAFAGAAVLGGILGGVSSLGSMIPLIGSIIGMLCYALIMLVATATMVLDCICRWKIYREYFPEPANIILLVVGVVCNAQTIITLVASFRKPVPAADGVIDDVTYCTQD